jgi:hypothetical protein
VLGDPAEQPLADAKLRRRRARMQRLAEAALGDEAHPRGVEQTHAGARRAQDRRRAVDGVLQLLLERQRVRQLTRQLCDACKTRVHASPLRLYVGHDGTARNFCNEFVTTKRGG